MVATINDRDVGIWSVSEFHCASQAPETAAYDDDMAEGGVSSVETWSFFECSHRNLFRSPLGYCLFNRVMSRGRSSVMKVGPRA